jgi:hypothetical protein
MALIVEDGTGVTDANSYADLVAIRAYAFARGITLSADDVALEPLAHSGMDYLESKNLGLLSITWPLDDGLLCGTIAEAEALTRLQNGLGRLCVEQHNGVDLAPTRTEAFIIEDTVGPMTTKYSDKLGGGVGSPPDMPGVDGILAPLLAACGQVSLFKTLRV